MYVRGTLLFSVRALKSSLPSDYEDRTTGSFVEKKLSSVTFHYRNADPVFGVFQGMYDPF